jgi:hypothetical protein
VVNVYVPIYSGWIVDALGRGDFCWGLILVYTLLRSVQSVALLLLDRRFKEEKNKKSFQ